MADEAHKWPAHHLLLGQNRFEDAIPVVENALKASPENQQFRDLLEQVRKKN